MHKIEQKLNLSIPESWSVLKLSIK